MIDRISRSRLIFGTAVASSVFGSTFYFTSKHPQWELWTGRAFCLVWLVFYWRQELEGSKRPRRAGFVKSEVNRTGVVQNYDSPPGAVISNEISVPERPASPLEGTLHSVKAGPEQVLYDASWAPWWFRLPFAMFGVVMFGLATDVLCSLFGVSLMGGQLQVSPGVALAMFLPFAYIFIATWFLRTRIRFESVTRQLVICTNSWWFLRWSCRYIPLEGATGIVVESAVVSRGRKGWRLSVVFGDSHRRPIMQAHDANRDELVKIFSQATGLAVLELSG
jgi:hypothetical protein